MSLSDDEDSLGARAVSQALSAFTLDQCLDEKYFESSRLDE